MPKKPRILFVDDEPNVLSALRREFRSRSGEWDMAFFSSPVEALRSQRSNPYDVAVTDLRMPTMDGFDAIRGLLEVSPHTVVIVLTGAADLSVVVKAINETPVFRFYPKPCATRELMRGIEDGLRHSEERAADLPVAPARGRGAAGVSWSSPENAYAEASVLDHLRIGAIIVDEQARIVFTNQTGADLIAKNDGLVITGVGACRAARTEDSERLHALIRDTARGDGTANGRTDIVLPLPRRLSERPLAVVAYRRTRAEAGVSTVLLLIHDPDLREGPTEGEIAVLLGLSVSEARLAKRLSDGEPLDSASHALGLTTETGRTYMKRIFQKTGARRQADLVRMVLTSTLAG